MNENFFGRTATYVSSPHRAEASCQVSAKSLGWLSGKTVYRPTNRPTDQPTIPSLTSTDVENCSVLRSTGSTSVTALLLDFFTPRVLDFLTCKLFDFSTSCPLRMIKFKFKISPIMTCSTYHNSSIR